MTTGHVLTNGAVAGLIAVNAISIAATGFLSFILGKSEGDRKGRQEEKKTYLFVLSFLTPQERKKLRERIDTARAQQISDEEMIFKGTK